VQAKFFASGAKSFTPPEASRRQARAGCGTDPRGGVQRSVHVVLSEGFEPSSQYVTRNDVALCGPAWEAPQAANAASAIARTTSPRTSTRYPRQASRLARVALSGKRVVVTGGAGFIGTTLARRLVEDNEIVAVDNLHRDSLGGTELAEHPNFHFVQGDVLDADSLTNVVRGATHLVHAAAIAGVDTVIESPVRTMRVNLIGTYNALEAALRTRDSVERIIEFSTSEVFGTYAYKVDEEHVTTQGSVGEARWTYAVSKLAGEHMAHAYHDELGLPTVSVRPFNVYGPGQIGGGAIRAFIETALAGNDLVIHGDGSQIRAWCYVDDMVEALLLTLEHPNAVGQSFNIGNARSAVTIYDLAQRIKRLSGCPGELVFQPLHYTDVELRIPNVDKARELLGFEAKVELDEGLERTIAWYRENGTR
jgi:UDP-glucose 4-epimerase